MLALIQVLNAHGFDWQSLDTEEFCRKILVKEISKDTLMGLGVNLDLRLIMKEIEKNIFIVMEAE